MSVQRLIEAARLTASPRNIDWGSVEQHLATRLPEDYRQLVAAGGAGLWFDTLRLFSPGDPVRSRDLLESGGVFEDLLIAWEDDPEYRPPDLPADARLIAWANTSHGETLFWRVDRDATSTAYPIYIENSDGAQWERFDMPTTDFLRGILQETVTSQFLSSDYLRTDKVFRGFQPPSDPS